MDANRTGAMISCLRDSVRDLVWQEEKLEDDIYLLLWLKVKGMCVKRAETSIRATMKWRLNHDLKAIEAEKFPRDFSDKIPLFIDGVSKQGFPVSYLRAIDLRVQDVYDYDRKDIIRYTTQVGIQAQNRAMTLNRKKVKGLTELSSDSVSSYCMILDAYDYTFKDLPNLRAVHIFHDIAQDWDRFPTSARNIICIGANKIFYVAMKIAAPIIERYGATVRAYGTDEESWQQELFQIITPRQLQEFRQRAQENRRNRLSVGA